MYSCSNALVSVLIPTCSPGDYFKKCLDSIEDQSIDKSLYTVYIALNGDEKPYKEQVECLIKKYSFNCFFTYTSELGVSNARNLLIEESVEEFICFVDDDDLLSPDYLLSLLSISSKEVVGITDVKAFDNFKEGSHKNYIGLSYSKLQSSESSMFKSRKYFSSPWAKMIHRSIVGETRFDINLRKGEDSLFMAELSPRVRMVRKSEPESCYYVYLRPGSATRRKDSTKEEVKKVFYLVIKFSKLFFTPSYDKAFVGSRVLAAFLQLRNILK